MEHFIPPPEQPSTDLFSDAHKSQIIGGDADEDHIPVSQNAQSAIFSLIAQVLTALLTQTQTQNRSYHGE